MNYIIINDNYYIAIIIIVVAIVLKGSLGPVHSSINIVSYGQWSTLAKYYLI